MVVLNVTISKYYCLDIHMYTSMPTLNVTLYGDIARYCGGKHIATLDLDLPDGTSIVNL